MLFNFTNSEMVDIFQCYYICNNNKRFAQIGIVITSLKRTRLKPHSNTFRMLDQNIRSFGKFKLNRQKSNVTNEVNGNGNKKIIILTFLRKSQWAYKTRGNRVKYFSKKNHER